MKQPPLESTALLEVIVGFMSCRESSCSDCYSCQFVPVLTDHRLHHALMVTVLAGRLEFELCLEVRMKGPVIRSVVSGSIELWDQPCCSPNA